MARPIIGKKKDCDIRVRIDDDLNRELLSYCNTNGTSRAETIRRAVEEFLRKKKNQHTGK